MKAHGPIFDFQAKLKIWLLEWILKSFNYNVNIKKNSMFLWFVIEADC